MSFRITTFEESIKQEITASITDNTDVIYSNLATISRFLNTVPVGTSANIEFPPVTGGPLSSIKIWIATPPAGAATIALRYFRYRNTGSGLQLTQMTNAINIDSSTAPFITIDVSDEIRSNITLIDGDVIAISTVYSLNGAADSVQALTIQATIASS